ncbi:MAG: polysaccharide biosynthesis tyrosine autokinase, partial [Synechococcales bacterium]|nr:polysaccharide biosynthesis tyrosine autokinase [Synechococcales bacterium]
EIKALTQKSDPLSTEAEILKSQPVLETTVKKVYSTKRSDDRIDRSEKRPDVKTLAKQLNVKPIPGTDIIRVSYKSQQASEAAQVVNQVMQAYIDNNIQVNQAQAERARQFIEKELQRKEETVRQAEDALRQFRETHGVVALERETEESVKNIGLLEQNIHSSKSMLSQAEGRVAQLRSQVGMDVKTALLVNALNQSETVQKALKDWRQAQADLAKQSTLYKDENPEIRILNDQVQAAESVLQSQVREITGQSLDTSVELLQLSETQQELVTDLARAEAERISLKQGLDSLLQSRSQAMAQSRTRPTLEATQRELQRRVDAAQTTYKTLLTKLQEVQVIENQSVVNARIVSNAVLPDQPAGPSRLLFLVGGGTVGLLLGLSIAFLVDYADQSIKTLPEVKRWRPYPMLGMIPQLLPIQQEGRSEMIPYLITQDYPHFGAQEAYQMLQANLRFLPTDQAAKAIMVTSGVRREGKSSVAANLALAMAQGQRRVLLVDADMREGCQHHIWNISNRVGLSNVLVGQVGLEDAIATIRPNLHVLTVGTMPPNPLVLLDSSTMANLVQRLREQYDFVIFDAPNLLGTADSTVLNRMVDGSLWVMRLGAMNIGQAKAIRQVIHQSGQRVLGMVINGIHAKEGQDGSFYPATQVTKQRSPSDRALFR